MSDLDKLEIIFFIIAIGYFFITEHLICKIERLYRQINFLKEDNKKLRGIDNEK